MLRRTSKITKSPPPLFPHLHPPNDPKLKLPPPPSSPPSSPLSSLPSSPPSSLPPSLPSSSPPSPPLWRWATLALMATGSQLLWAVQFSILVHYVRRNSDPTKWNSLILLLAPLLRIPVTAFESGEVTFRLRAAFYMVVASMSVIVSFGFLAKTEGRSEWFLAFMLVVLIWVADMMHDNILVCSRKFLAEYSSNNRRKIAITSAFYSFFMAFGSVLAYVSGSFPNFYKLLNSMQAYPSCDFYGANLPAFLASCSLLGPLNIMALHLLYKPKPQIKLQPQLQAEPKPRPRVHILKYCREESAYGEGEGHIYLVPPMWVLLVVTALNWVAWFPFLLYDTDWLGKMYGGDAHGHNIGVGSLGLMLMAGTLGILSLLVDCLSRWLGGGSKTLWDMVSYILVAELAVTVGVTKMAYSASMVINPDGVKAASLYLFSFMAIPQAVTFSIPFAPKLILDRGYSGVSTVMIVIAQMLVLLISGSLDALSGAHYSPAFVLGFGCAVMTGVVVVVLKVLFLSAYSKT